MEQTKLNKISEFTKTETWGIFKEFFSEREDKLLKFMRKLDLDDEEQRKKYKGMNDKLDAFQSLILEIEWIETERVNNEKIQEINEDMEEFLLPTWKEKVDIDE